MTLRMTAVTGSEPPDAEHADGCDVQLKTEDTGPADMVSVKDVGVRSEDADPTNSPNRENVEDDDDEEEPAAIENDENVNFIDPWSGLVVTTQPRCACQRNLCKRRHDQTAKRSFGKGLQLFSKSCNTCAKKKQRHKVKCGARDGEFFTVQWNSGQSAAENGFPVNPFQRDEIHKNKKLKTATEIFPQNELGADMPMNWVHSILEAHERHRLLVLEQQMAQHTLQQMQEAAAMMGVPPGMPPGTTSNDLIRMISSMATNGGASVDPNQFQWHG